MNSETDGQERITGDVLMDSPQEIMTKDRLYNYLGIQLRVQSREERLERMKSNEQIPAARGNDGSKHTASGYDRMSNAVIKRLEYEEKIREPMAADKAELAAIESAIEAISDPMEQEVLRLRYTEPTENNRRMRWRDVAMRMYHDDSDADILRVQRLHQKALEHITRGRLWNDSLT